MNNTAVQAELTACSLELDDVAASIKGLGILSSTVPYLTKYALIRACGTIERAFKTLIADFCSQSSTYQIKQFLTKKVRDNSANPKLDRIHGMLNDFDESWSDSLKASMKRHADRELMTTALTTLVDARNEFAHGGSPNVSIGDVQSHFMNARKVIEIMDAIIR